MQEYDRTDASFYDLVSQGLNGDLEFYLEEMELRGSPVLELGTGTGRILIPAAEAGHQITGLDLAPSMLAIARDKVSQLQPEVQERISIVEGDMRDFDLGRKFRLVIIPYRAFCHLYTVEDQRKALTAIGNHLEPGGYLTLNFFDPSLEIITAHSSQLGQALTRMQELELPDSDHRVVLWTTRRYDMERQMVNEYRIFEEIDAEGVVVKKTYTPLNVRWTYRYEMEHLLELCGFEVDALYGDFNRGPFEYGREQVWVARKTG